MLLQHAKSRRLRKIEQSDIGVVTPYKKQCWRINNRLHRLRYDGITVGTSEVFQGKERPVMIVSTVRADGQSLGFVKEKRVNMPSFCVIALDIRSIGPVIEQDLFFHCRDSM